MSKKLQKAMVLAAMTAGLLLAGCGNRMPAASPIDAPSASGDAPTVAPPVTTPSQAPIVTAPVTPANPNYQAPITGSLVISNLSKKKTGLIFKKMVVTASVVNTSQVPLSGTVKIVFKESKGIFTKRLEEAETKTLAVANLAPGASMPIDVTSNESGVDEVEVTVESTPAAGNAATASAYGAASPYGASLPGAGAGAYGY